MEELSLLRVRTADAVFAQYIPQSFHPLLHEPNTVCVGAQFRGMACGAAIAERTEDEEYHLRYIYVDPQARFCGLGTYLLRGLMGEVRREGAEMLRAVYTLDMVESGAHPGILTRAGMTPPDPISTMFRTVLGDIPHPATRLPERMAVVAAHELPAPAWEEYCALSDRGEWPLYTDWRRLHGFEPYISTFALANGHPVGVILVQHETTPQALRLAGVYILPAWRGSRLLAAMVRRTWNSAAASFSLETEVTASTVNRESFALCEKLFTVSPRGRKDTEFMSSYRM